ncbi:MAG: MauE/DoxX family redox-associated membrane protein [Desulfovibrionaceae bacterium]
MPAFHAILASSWLYRCTRYALAAVFLAAGTLKAAAPESMASVIAGFGIAPAPAIPALSLLLPLLEIIAAVGLAWDVEGALAVLTALLATYLGVVWYGIITELGIDCGCFGPGVPGLDSLRAAFLRNVALLGAAGYLYWVRYVRPDIRLRGLFGGIRRDAAGDM